MGRMPLLLTFVLTLAALTAGVLTLTAVPEPASAQAAAYAYDGQGTKIAVRPLDDPANPYRGQYGEIEAWLIEHAETYEEWRARSMAEMEAQRAALPDPKGPLHVVRNDVTAFVTPEGWLKPMPLPPSFRLMPSNREPGTPAEEINRHAGPRADFKQEDIYYLIAPETALPAPLLAERQELQERQRFDGVPPIPAWLGTRPPQKLHFAPNGDYLVYGPLNRHYEPAPWVDPGSPRGEPADQPRAEAWYRYSSDGKLLGTLPGSEDGNDVSWTKLFWPEADTMLNSHPRDERNISIARQGWWVGWTDPRSFRDPEDGPPVVEVYAAWDYLGKPLPLDQPVPTELATFWNYGQDRIAEAYALQLKYGVTSAETLSPYESTPQGPVVVDPTPLPWPRTAHKNYGPGEIRVLAQDDPANPYRGQYSDWDRWIWQQFGARDPKEPRFYAPGDKRIGGTWANYYRTWRSVFVPVTDDGAQVPLVVVGQQDAQRELGWDRRDPSNHEWKSGNYSMSAAGELDWAQWTQYTAARLGNALGLYPRMPDWLLAQPVAYVSFVPNGDVVTHGPLGSYDTSPDLDLPDRYKAGRDAPYHVYGPDGRLKATLPLRQTGGWARHYWPAELAAKIDAWQAEGRSIETEDGYTLIFSGPRYGKDEKGNSHKVDPPPALIAAYDWNGTPMDIAQPLTRPDYHTLSLRWDEVRDVAAGQALVGQ
jgi:hypothetical protein